MRRGLVAHNPAAGVELPACAAPLPCLHSPDETKRVLEAARASDLQAMRLLAIRYFAGVRSAEAMRLREADVQLDRGFIEVPAAKAKTRARRLVPISPALRAWLSLGGELGPMRADRVRQVIQGAGVPWPKNVTRHTFISYRLAECQDAARVALEAGTSEAMLFKHYRELATPAEAAAFFALRPTG